jgi:ATP-dependent Clp protease ATP-binding subunit ClpA
MPTFSRSLEQSLHRALALANERHHEYATLEHLLLALLEDQDAAAVMRACNVDLQKLRHRLVAYLESELDNLVTDGAEDSKPTAGFQRVIQRAVIHVQSSGHEEVTGANVLVAIFAERESHAAYFLQEQDMTRYDAVNYISHGIAKRPGVSEARPVRGADEDNDTKSGGERAVLRPSTKRAWSNATSQPDGTRIFQFGWNNSGKNLPPGAWDTGSSTPASPFRNLILQASGLGAMAAAATLAPTTEISHP